MMYRLVSTAVLLWCSVGFAWAAEPAPAETDPMAPAPADPGMAEPAPAEPAPAEPGPAAPAPADEKPADEKPADAVPAIPPAVDPAPAPPKPAAPAPAVEPLKLVVEALLSPSTPNEEYIALTREVAARKAEAIPLLVEQLKTASELTQLRILGTLSRMGPDAAPAVPEFRSRLRDKSPYLRAAAIKCLHASGDAAKETLPELYQALQDPDPITVGWAARTIQVLEPDFFRSGLNDFLVRLDTPLPKVERLSVQMWYRLATRNLTDRKLASDMQQWKLIADLTGRDDTLTMGEVLGIEEPRPAAAPAK